jgi:hypothetical protein
VSSSWKAPVRVEHSRSKNPCEWFDFIWIYTTHTDLRFSCRIRRCPKRRRKRECCRTGDLIVRRRVISGTYVTDALDAKARRRAFVVVLVSAPRLNLTIGGASSLLWQKCGRSPIFAKASPAVTPLDVITDTSNPFRISPSIGPISTESSGISPSKDVHGPLLFLLLELICTSRSLLLAGLSRMITQQAILLFLSPL